MKLTKEKNKLYQLTRKYPDSAELKRRYKSISRSVVEKVRKDKKSYYGNLLRDYKSDAKKYCRLINDLSGRRTDLIECIEIGGRLLKVDGDSVEIAESFAKHFSDSVASVVKGCRSPGDIVGLRRVDVPVCWKILYMFAKFP